MSPSAAEAETTLPGAFALGSFRDAAGRAFAGLVVGDLVLDLGGTGSSGGTDVAGSFGGPGGADGLDGTAGFGGVQAPGGRVSVEGLLADWDASFAWLASLAAAHAAADGADSAAWYALAGLRPLPPLRPGQILQSGANYRKHVVDIVVSEWRDDPADPREEPEVRAWAEDMMDRRAANSNPYIFIGLPGALCGAHDDVVLPRRGTRHDWELELAAVIGRPARHVPREKALDYVAGYTICNDLTTRSLVYRPDLKAIGTDWFAAKNAPTFLPTGPYLVPAAFVPDPMDLRITLSHNGVVRQDESTADMLFDLPALISYASSVVELRPGDLLLTGSPAGNGAHWGVFLAPGDVLESSITGLGSQRNTCVAEAPPHPGQHTGSHTEKEGARA